MDASIQFYYNPMSRARTVQWMLEEVGEPYEIKLLDWKKADHKTPEYLAINPMGKIPAIVHRGVVVTECAAICAYLADAFPRAQLAPSPESPERGPYYRWLFFAAGCMDPAVSELASPRVNGEKSRGMLGYGTLEDTLRTVEKAVGRDRYLAGSRFSAADLYVGSMLGWFMQFGLIPPRPAFKIYVENLQTRPAYIRATGKADAMIASMNPSAS